MSSLGSCLFLLIRSLVRPLFYTLLLVMSAMGCPTFAQATAPPGVDVFFRDPDTGLVRISPSGTYLAVIRRIQGGRYGLVIFPTAAPSDAKIIARSDQTDVLNVNWVNDERVTFVTGDRSGEGVWENLNGSLFAINRDGSDSLELISGAWNAPPKPRVLPANYVPMLWLQDGSDDIVVGARSVNGTDQSVRHIQPYRLNTRTRALTPLVDPGLPRTAKQWLFDRDGQPRVFTGFDKGRRTVYYRDADSKEWQTLGDFDAAKAEGFSPAFFGYDDWLYVVVANTSGTNALYRYDVKKRQVEDQPIFKVDGFDYVGYPEMDPQTKKVLGFHYLTDAWGTFWTDAHFKDLQAKIDQHLPDTINQISCGNCSSSKMLLVTANSDRQPTSYLLFDPATNQLTKLADSRPLLQPKAMGERSFFTFKARDGLSIPVYVTVPPGKPRGPLPTVVLVHGGPWVRGATWEWTDIPQFLATRGYAVIEPEFRGSSGFGYPLFQASWRQWGLAMQDDLSDAATWAIKKGIADPKRMAIGGASYGGYATLMGLVKNPELFRCGFEWLGVTDPGLLFSVAWNDATIDALTYTYPFLVGDPVKDAAQFQATSPIANAARITQPLLMAYGAADRRVPVVQGEKLRDAIGSSNKNVEWIVYPEEGHGWHIEAHNIDFWTHVEKFLDTYLKNAPPSS